MLSKQRKERRGEDPEGRGPIARRGVGEERRKEEERKSFTTVVIVLQPRLLAGRFWRIYPWGPWIKVKPGSLTSPPDATYLLRHNWASPL